MPFEPGTADAGEEGRYQAARALDATRPQERAALLEHLSDVSWRVRRAAVDRLGALVDPQPVLPGLLDILAAGPRAGARSAAASALVLAGPPAVPSLLARLGSAVPELRGAVVEVLGEIRDRRAAPVLAGLLADPDSNVRSAAAEALGKIGGTEATEALLEVAAGGADAPRAAALDALDRLRVAPPVELLVELARDRFLKRLAYRLLGRSDDPASHGLLAAGAFEPSRSSREAALAAIGRLRLRRPAAGLGSLAEEVRAAASRAGDGAALVASVLGSGEPRLAAGAVSVLGWVGDARHAAAVAEVAENEDLRPLVLEALREMGPGLRAAVANTLRRLSPAAQVTVLSALTHGGDAAALLGLVRELESDDEKVRSAAVEALVRVGALTALSPLAALLDHPEGAVAGAAAAVLAALAARGESERRQVHERCRSLPGRAGDTRLRLLGRIDAGASGRGDLGDRPAGASTFGPSPPASLGAGLAAEAPRPGGGVLGAGDAGMPAMSGSAFRLLRQLIHEHCGIWVRDELQYVMERRLAARLKANGLDDFEAYYRLLCHGSTRLAEIEEAAEALATNETYLFREAQQLRAFSEEILPLLAQRNARERRLRVWSAGCSSGEEVYTVAILVKESKLFEGWDVLVFGADLSRRVIGKARQGAYGEHAFRVPEAEGARRWFRPLGERWVVDDAIRALVRFDHMNLLDEQRVGRLGTLDAVFCRNVLIYFDLSARRRLLKSFHERLGAGGFLFLGHSESLVNVTADFELVHLKADLVYRKPLPVG